jgi:hypothetical protein
MRLKTPLKLIFNMIYRVKVSDRELWESNWVFLEQSHEPLIRNLRTSFEMFKQANSIPPDADITEGKLNEFINWWNTHNEEAPVRKIIVYRL